jgi:predicted PurR-regulated permease PerM
MPNTGQPRYINLPVYSKISQIILAIIGFFFIIYVGQSVLTPLVFAFLFSILLNPVVSWFCAKGLNRVLAILCGLLIFFVAILGVVFFIGMQLSTFTESFPQFKQHFAGILDNTVHWISVKFNIAKPSIYVWLEKIKKDGIDNGPAMIGQTLGTIGGILTVLVLLPVYMFTILYYKPLFLEFIAQLFERKKYGMVAEVLAETKTLIQSYLIGLSIEFLMVATMNSLGLLIIGVKYGILIGIIGALLNIIPYIGGIIAILLPILITVATGGAASQVFWVIALYLFVQFVDNNLIVTRIVASKVKINALVSIVVVLIGGALWGVSGMFLSIPVIALVKIIFDRIEPLQPFGFLLGDNQPDFTKTIFQFRKKKNTVSDPS